MRSAATAGSAEARLLVVDDEETILGLLSGSLRFAGFEVATAASGAEALRAAAASRPDLVLLDVTMPDGDGFEVLRRMRSSGPDVPVIFLTARDAVPERVTGLALGADDYVTKPFSLDEVLERIRAVLRRTGRPAAATRLRVDGLELDDDSHEVRRDGVLISLTPTEFRLLRFLMLNAGRVLSKGQILDHVWGHNPADGGSVVEPCVSYLRRKVDQSEPRLIHTIRGVGYVLRVPPP
jgi:two-component system, OmpR family, response regulator